LKAKATRDQGLQEAAAYLQEIDTSPSASEEADYFKASNKDRFKDLYGVLEVAIPKEEAVKDFQEQKSALACKTPDKFGLKESKPKVVVFNKTVVEESKAHVVKTPPKQKGGGETGQEGMAGAMANIAMAGMMEALAVAVSDVVQKEMKAMRAD
jgi:hypothetical protein